MFEELELPGGAAKRNRLVGPRLGQVIGRTARRRDAPESFDEGRRRGRGDGHRRGCSEVDESRRLGGRGRRGRDHLWRSRGLDRHCRHERSPIGGRREERRHLIAREVARHPNDRAQPRGSVGRRGQRARHRLVRRPTQRQHDPLPPHVDEEHVGIAARWRSRVARIAEGQDRPVKLDPDRLSNLRGLGSPARSDLDRDEQRTFVGRPRHRGPKQNAHAQNAYDDPPHPDLSAHAGTVARTARFVQSRRLKKNQRLPRRPLAAGGRAGYRVVRHSLPSGWSGMVVITARFPARVCEKPRRGPWATFCEN